MNDIITGKVVRVIDEYQIVINRGEKDGVCKGQKFLVYKLDEEIIDPDTNENLGMLEIVCGEGSVEHVQDKMSTLKSARFEKTPPKKVIRRTRNIPNNLPVFIGGNLRETEEEYSSEEKNGIPFEDVDTTCLVKRIF